MMSPPLTAIFDIPEAAPTVDKDGKGQPAEGTEEKPMIIPGITSDQLNDFLGFFFKSCGHFSWLFCIYFDSLVGVSCLLRHFHGPVSSN